MNAAATYPGGRHFGLVRIPMVKVVNIVNVPRYWATRDKRMRPCP
jgi:hypothetical protein